MVLRHKPWGKETWLQSKNSSAATSILHSVSDKPRRFPSISSGEHLRKGSGNKVRLGVVKIFITDNFAQLCNIKTEDMIWW